MTLRSPSRLLLLLCATALVAGCPGDDVPLVDSGNASSGSGTTTTTTALPTTTEDSATTLVMTGSASADTTIGPMDSSTSSDSATTGTTTDASGTTGDPSTSSDGGSSSEGGTTTGGMALEGYAECAFDPAQCLMDEECGSDSPFSPTFTVCIGQDCMDPSDCPVPPPGGTAMPACMDISSDMVNDCYLDCSMGETCPTGMDCFFNTLCVWPTPPPGYGDCVTDPMACLMDESCYVDDVGMPTFGVCADLDCMDITECPLPPPGGTAGRACDDINGDMVDDCYLDCSMGETCPTGMDCIAGTHCAWPVAPPNPVGYGDCNADPMVCLVEEVCVVDDAGMPTVSFCSDVTCVDPSDCPAAPPGGTAPVACDMLVGDGDGDCYVDCSMGETCPTGMDCFGGFVCAWPVAP